MFKSASSTSSSSPFWNITSVFSSTTTQSGNETDCDASTTVDGNTGHEMIDRTLSQVEGGLLTKDSSFLCAPYKAELFQQQMDDYEPGSNRRTAVISALQDLGVKVFIIDSVSTPSTCDVVHHVRRVVNYMARENWNGGSNVQSSSNSTANTAATCNGPLLGYQRCLLYQDNQGRLFNLILSEHAIGPVDQFVQYCNRFSNMEAVVALLILVRTLPSARDAVFCDSFQPALLAAVLGFVLREETSLSWLNVTMMVRAAPSVSAAHSLMGMPSRDAIYKWTLLCLVLAGAIQGTPAQVLLFMGITGACMMLLANLGARAWYNLQWQPQQYDGFGAFVLAYATAVMAGIMVPFMAHRDVRTGGRGAVEHVLATSLVVAVVFTITSVTQVQQQILGMSHTSTQNAVNLTVGIWWLVTVMWCLLLAAGRRFQDAKPFDSERFLVPHHSSPAGYKVPCLPDYEIDPALARIGRMWFMPPCFQLVFSLLAVCIVGSGMLCLVYSNWDETTADQVQSTLNANDL
ncbi:hypothetical protein MPSEU_000554200 [Mayamaea pseudoterrestris]|nr:hypothetical protein MPSEU_000554200 [Mayamaea pseudoterrestris]